MMGPLKILGTGAIGSISAGKRGWFYPCYLISKDAIIADVQNNGKGIYVTISFQGRQGEFYMPESFSFLAMAKDPIIYTAYTGQGTPNPFKKIQNRLSELVESQLPDFIQSEYVNFIKFIKAYYQFIEQSNASQEVLQNMRQYGDIDRTSAELVEKFLSTYAYDYTKSEFANNSLVLKRINELYDKKGTENAYDILFNILFKETIEFFYPFTVVLKASDGKWEIPYSIRVKKLYPDQNLYEFENTRIIGQTSRATAVVQRVIKFDLGEYEVFEMILDSVTLNGVFIGYEEIVADKLIELEDNRKVYSRLNAELYGNVLTAVKIIDPGFGYGMGHMIRITDPDRPPGVYASAAVSGINQNGGITKIQVLEAGLNYSANTIADAGQPGKIFTGTAVTVGRTTVVTLDEPLNLPRGYEVKITHTGNPASPIFGAVYTTKVIRIIDSRTFTLAYPVSAQNASILER